MRGTVRWLLFSDIHFRHNDPGRLWQTALWIVAEAKRNKVKRVVICGDLLTSRTMQRTDVLSACYRFIGLLSDAVPRVHIVLGNHDLAYRRDYQTSALNALSISRLSPFVSLHNSITHDKWDGRRVLLLPFREEQHVLTEAVAALDPEEASQTVAFAHLAINKAITQRHVVSADKSRAASSITYRGLTGSDHFASLARTFTGHFHSHQTIRNNVGLQGSITYLGSPLQLSWADLNDEQRGVTLFDPETLEHELLVNPHVVDYITIDIQQVLDGRVSKSAVAGKYVMLVGEVDFPRYLTARHMVSSILGARDVRKWTPAGFTFNDDHSSFGGLGASVPESDAGNQLSEKPSAHKLGLESESDGILGSAADTEPQVPQLDLAAEARKYVDSLELGKTLLPRRDALVRIGQQVIQVSREMPEHNDEINLDHRDFLDPSSQALGTKTATELAGPSSHIFVAEPRKLTITNFLGVQGTIVIDFEQDLPRGLSFLVGENGSGKSTLVEAMVWCQFGQCIRSGLLVNDVVNDNVGKNCCVILEFANGYTIARYRKHKSHGNRIVVSLNGEPQTQLEHPDARTTQAAIDELLGTDYEKYVRTVVLSHESASSFLNSKPTQRREIIEASVGLSVLDQCGQVSKLLLKDVEKEVDGMDSKLRGLLWRMEHIEGRIKDLERKQMQHEEEMKKAVTSLKKANKEHAAVELQIDKQGSPGREESARHRHAEFSTLQDLTYVEQEVLQDLQRSYARIQKQRQPKYIEPTSWLGKLQREISQRLLVMTPTRPAGLRKLLHGVKTAVLRFQLMAVSIFLYISGTSNRDSQAASIQNEKQELAILSLREELDAGALRLHILKHEVDRLIEVEELAINDALMTKKQLTRAIQAQKTCEALEQQVALKKKETDMYQRFVNDEQAHLNSLRSEHDTLAATLRELAANRELFSFWSSAMAKRASRVSSSSSSRSTTKAAANFRDHILGKMLSELNALLAQVLTILYDDTRHARSMATGMLRSIFDPDSVDVTLSAAFSSSGPVLDRTLAVHPSLAYGKRSSGERKRVDLALYFALLQLTWARSPHRAHYLLVDEVFDSLDEAGQAAVIRWCGLMSQTVGWVVVITHSPFLVRRDLEDDAGKIVVVEAKKGDEGTELAIDGRRIGVEEES